MPFFSVHFTVSSFLVLCWFSLSLATAFYRWFWTIIQTLIHCDILSHVSDFTELLLAYTCPSSILQRKFDDRPINANDGSMMAGCNKSKTHVIRRPKRIFCQDAFHPPGSGPQQRKTCCKANSHLKKIWSNIIVIIKMYVPARATSRKRSSRPNLFKLVSVFWCSHSSVL